MYQKEGECLLGRINSFSDELNAISVKETAFVEIIAHLRARITKIERRKREIHLEISDLKEEVRALEEETARLETEKDNKSSNN